MFCKTECNGAWLLLETLIPAVLFLEFRACNLTEVTPKFCRPAQGCIVLMKICVRSGIACIELELLKDTKSQWDVSPLYIHRIAGLKDAYDSA
jgi:hypothetical protein